MNKYVFFANTQSPTYIHTYPYLRKFVFKHGLINVRLKKVVNVFALRGLKGQLLLLGQAAGHHQEALVLVAVPVFHAKNLKLIMRRNDDKRRTRQSKSEERERKRANEKNDLIIKLWHPIHSHLSR